jgi:hypothetical protein
MHSQALVRHPLLTAILFGALAAACGSEDPAVVSDFPSPKPVVADPKPTDGFADTTPTPPEPEPSKPAVGFEWCATSTTAAVPKPVHLVFAYDQSGSMGGSGKWEAAGAAMKGFFTSPATKGLNASLTFFPKYEAVALMCSASEYAAPDVAMTALPSATFGSAIDATAPKPGKGGTPTVAALTGTMGYAQSLLATTAKDETVALVMVTDGIPEICSDKGDVGPASLVAAANASTIPTYVVGVGNNLANLDQIAAAGGTTKAFMVPVGNPAQTQAELTTAIDAIRTSTLSCDYAIPKAPAGQSFDAKRVNVQFAPPGLAASAISYDQACASGTGWRYDNAANPTRILACDGTCGTIKASGGKVDIVFGCATVQNTAPAPSAAPVK